MCPPMIVWPNAICFHFVRKNINKQYITQNVFLTMSLQSVSYEEMSMSLITSHLFELYELNMRKL